MFDLSDKENKKERMKAGERIRLARKNKGFTQEQLAEIIGVERTAVTSWESGNSLPEIRRYSDLCKALDVDCGYLLGDYEEKEFSNNRISESTGLSESAIERLKRMKKRSDHSVIPTVTILNEDIAGSSDDILEKLFTEDLSALSRLLESSLFIDLCSTIIRAAEKKRLLAADTKAWNKALSAETTEKGQKIIKKLGALSPEEHKKLMNETERTEFLANKQVQEIIQHFSK